MHRRTSINMRAQEARDVHEYINDGYTYVYSPFSPQIAKTAIATAQSPCHLHVHSNKQTMLLN